MNVRSWTLLPWGLLFPIAPWGCASQAETRLYHLAPEQSVVRLSTGERDLRLGVGAVQIPSYLDRPQIVTRLNRNELQLSELDHWAEPLSRNIESVLAENLMQSIGVQEVRRQFGNRGVGLDCRVDVRVLRFEGQLEGTCHLAAEWSLSGAALGPLEIQRRSVLEGPANGAGLAGVVGGLNDLMGRLSGEIAEAIAQFVSVAPGSSTP